ncbi:hypothetical protein SAMN02910451_01912 [Butyrivibrio hungatei]|uniref:Uncharacterized protein n=1 Tax=Butyrivibrio hungatei TaxID=185008 RepID=A0A1G5ECE5_9FIRM|nr:hypothetical protein [Butyrivibrio hungatei]SCY24587.1 hypothetical protein SAMN02910451_01912 [Butyrivibrio hungatei]
MDNHTVSVSIITSLIASIAFWFGFDFIPSRLKYLRIRPRVEKDLDDIRFHLFFFIQIPFLQSVHTASFYQTDIEDKKLQKSDFENALYGKCLSEDRQNDSEHNLLAVGKKLEENANDIDKRIDRIQRYSNYLKTKEILLIKEIGEKIHTYDFVDGLGFKTVNPTISYMSGNFYELYSLYHNFKVICDSYWFLNRNDFQKYNIIVGMLEKRKYISSFIRWMFLGEIYKTLVEVRYYFLKGNMKKVKLKLQKVLRLDKDRQVPLNLFLDYLLNENEVRDILIRSRGEQEVQNWISNADSEKIWKNNFESRNIQNKKYIEEKMKNAPKITEYNLAQLKAVNKLFDGYIK